MGAFVCGYQDTTFCRLGSFKSLHVDVPGNPNLNLYLSTLPRELEDSGVPKPVVDRIYDRLGEKYPRRRGAPRPTRVQMVISTNREYRVLYAIAEGTRETGIQSADFYDGHRVAGLVISPNKLLNYGMFVQGTCITERPEIGFLELARENGLKILPTSEGFELGGQDKDHQAAWGFHLGDPIHLFLLTHAGTENKSITEAHQMSSEDTAAANRWMLREHLKQVIDAGGFGIIAKFLLESLSRIQDWHPMLHDEIRPLNLPSVSP